MPTTYHGFPMPVFPCTWYHPIHGARQIKDYAEWWALDDNWRPSAGEADMHRTETAAQLTQHHAIAQKREEMMRAQAPIVTNSVQYDENARQHAVEPERAPPPPPRPEQAPAKAK